MAQVNVQQFCDQQKQIISTSLKSTLKKGDIWYLICTKWFNQWKKFVGYDPWDTGSVSDQAVLPGFIDNRPIFKEDSPGVLREHLMDELDYVLVPEAAWNQLITWYSLMPGQEGVARKVIEHGMFVRHLKVEVYLLDLKLCCGRKEMGKQIIKQFSRSDTIHSIEVAMRQAFSIERGREVRLWNKYMSNTFERLDRPDSTIEHSGLYQGQVVVVEQKNTDGSWSCPGDGLEVLKSLEPGDSTASGSDTSTKPTHWQEGKNASECHRYMLDNELACDVTFQVGPDGGATEMIRAHKYTLAARSPVFFSMFYGELKESDETIRVEDLDRNIFRDMLLYMYCDTIRLSPEKISSVMYASEKYMLSGLTSHCEDWMDKNLDNGNACAFFECASFFRREQLAHKAHRYILGHASAVLKTAGVTSLSQGSLEELLSSDELQAQELEIYTACLKWAEQQCLNAGQEVTGPAMRRALGQCLYSIRFPLMEGSVFVEMVEQNAGVLTKEEENAVLKAFHVPGTAGPFCNRPRGCIPVARRVRHRPRK